MRIKNKIISIFILALLLSVIAIAVMPVSNAQITNKTLVSFLVTDPNGNSLSNADVKIYEDSYDRPFVAEAKTNQFGIATFNLTNGKEYIIEGESEDGAYFEVGEFSIPTGYIRNIFYEFALSEATRLSAIGKSQYMPYIYVVIIALIALGGFALYRMFKK